MSCSGTSWGRFSLAQVCLPDTSSTTRCHNVPIAFGRVVDSDDVDRTRRDYDAVAEAYDNLVRGDNSTDPLQTAMITAFAELTRSCPSGAGVLDAGCGPGHWTDHLDRLGISTRGIDLSPAMVAIARRYRPDLRFEVGSILELEAADASFAGVLAHFSLIHTPPHLVPLALAEFARVLAPGGTFLIAGQICDTGDPSGWAPYDHKASPAYLWTLDALADQLYQHEFTELARLRIAVPPQKRIPAGYLLAQRQPHGR